MKEKVILAGYGGQGIMLSGMLIAYAGMLDHYEVSWVPSYGPEMRGGTANCNVIISSDPISSPVVRKATSAIIMNQPSLDKFISQIEAGGSLFLNSSLVDDHLQRQDISVFRIPANNIADDIGSSKTANMVMIGAYIAAADFISREAFSSALAAVLSKKNKDLIPQNMKAFDEGFEYFLNLNEIKGAINGN